MKILKILILFLGTILIIQQFLLKDESYKENSVEYWDLAVYAKGSKCVNSGDLGFEIKVEFKDLGDRRLGEYKVREKTIYLSETDIDTVAHEVYHATQDIILNYGLKDDEEYGAYLQGFLTGCVMEIVYNRAITKNDN